VYILRNNGMNGEHFMRIGFLTSVNVTLNAFFNDWFSLYSEMGHDIFAASSGHYHHPSVRYSRIDALSQSPRLKNAIGPLALRSWVRSNSLDLVVTNTATASLLVRISRLNVPIVYFCHGLHYDSRKKQSFPKLLEYLAAKAHKQQTAVALNSFDVNEFQRFGIPCVLLPGGVGLDLDHYRPLAAPPPQDRLRLAWIGSFSKRKRPFDAVEVLVTLRDLGVNSEIFFFGDGPLRHQVQESVDREGLGAGVSFFGHCDPRIHLAQVHALLHTSEWEGLSRAVLESVAMALPVYGYSVKGVRDISFVSASQATGDSFGLGSQIAFDWRETGIQRMHSLAGWNDYREGLCWRKQALLCLDHLESLA
jgi:glycosyltransferase involved in cell wall biosynthesis